jgi:predicted Zn-dependent protease
MKTHYPRQLLGILTLAGLGLIIAACSTVPLTGRKQLNIIPASQMLSMSYQEYGTFLKSNKLSTDAQGTAMVKRIGGRIQGAVERYFKEKGIAGSLAGYQWEFNLVEDKQVNAWCMPGGKVVVYTGILPVAKTEEGLAVVMGHEIAHAVADHGNERMSQGLLAQLGGMGLDVARKDKPQQTRDLWQSAFGMGTQVGVLLPFSRTQESEADELGLTFMAMAGYDPHEALTFWQRMSASAGQAPLELLSTHPSDATRIRQIQEHLPEALKYYTPSR